MALIKILLTNLKKFVIDAGSNTQYFILEAGAREGDPISYLLILAIGILFILTNKKNVEVLNTFDYNYTSPMEMSGCFS